MKTKLDDLAMVVAMAVTMAVAAPVARLLGAKVEQGLSGLRFPALCWRHGWVDSPCERCAVWETDHTFREVERVDSAERAALGRMQRVEQPKDR